MRLADRRLLLGPDALLSIDQACQLAPARPAVVRELIERTGIARRLAGTRCVRWGDLVALAEFEEGKKGERPAVARRPLKRSKL